MNHGIIDMHLLIYLQCGGVLMIEAYLEKNILRQLFLCGQFYTTKEIDLDTTSSLLQVCKTTLLNDIKALKKELEPDIIYASREKENYSLYFAPTVPRYHLMQQLARPSLFLKTIQLYLEDEPDYIQLTEAEFVSVSKAYSLKKQVLNYFADCGIKIDHYSPKFTEVERRLLLLNVAYRTGCLKTPILPPDFWEEVEIFIDTLTAMCGRIYDKENREILRTGLLVSYISQSTWPLSANPHFIEEIKKRPIYYYVKKTWEKTNLKNHYEKAEFYFLLVLFNLCDYGFDSYDAIEEDFRQLHQVFIEDDQEIQKLINRFETHFEHPFIGNKAFERALIRLMRSTWDNYQLFMPEKFYLLSKEQQRLLAEVTPVFQQWQDQLSYDLRINNNCLDAFIIELSGILRLDKSHFHLYIVTNSDVRYLIYREALEAVTTCVLTVEPTIYSQLTEELKMLATKENTRVLCERTLYTPDALSFPAIIPVSVDTIEKAIVLAVK